MAGGQERILRRRIRSVQSTKKITRAMELIAASRIVKAQARVAAAVPYADRITDVARHLQESGGSNHPLLLPRPEIRAVALVVIGADRGLCGGYNSSVIRAAEAEIREHARAGRVYTLVTAGRKVESYFRFRNYHIRASHSGFSGSPSYEDAREIASSLLQPFEAGELDLVQTVYTRFISAGRQEVIVRPLLPLDSGDFALLSAPVIAAIRRLPEHDRYLRGLRSWVGFRQVGINVDRRTRAAGQPKYTTWKLVRLALDGICSFSVVPLRAATIAGLLAIAAAGGFSLYAVYQRLIVGTTPVGFTASVVLMTFLSGVQLTFLGVLGEYLGRIYGESKGRPSYVVAEVKGKV